MISKIHAAFFTLLVPLLSVGQNWISIKDTVSPIIELTTEYDSIYRQPLSGLGWEDGVHISNDGLHLYSTYVPIDLLSFSLNGDLPNNFSSNYLRGAPTFGMDLISNPLSAPEWLHADILYSNRNSLNDSFDSWELSNMSRSFYSEGAPSPLFGNGPLPVEMLLFTSNDNATNNLDIWMVNNTNYNPSGVGSVLPSPVNTTFNEDNPNLSKLQGDSLILFYNSDNLPGGAGDIDLWYSTSFDGGITWNTPVNVSSVNTSSREHHPFLHYDISNRTYYLYYSSYHTDGKLAIFRRKQLTSNHWNDWSNPELVISSGNSAGIGEPTLTRNGDISFVVVYEDPLKSSVYNQFDSDPWYLRKKDISANVGNTNQEINQLSIYPNPSSERIFIDVSTKIARVEMFSMMGQLVYSGNDRTVNIHNFPDGIYTVSVLTKSGATTTKLFIKK